MIRQIFSGSAERVPKEFSGFEAPKPTNMAAINDRFHA